MKLRYPRVFAIALFLLSVGMAGVSAQPFSAQIQLAFQQLGLWPFGIYTTGSVPTYNAALGHFVPSGGSGSVILLPPSTCAAPALAEAGAVTTGIAFTATPSILNCVSGTARSTLTTSSLTLTVPVLLPDGTSGAPTLSFASQTNLGWYKAATNAIAGSLGGAVGPVFLDVGMRLSSAQPLGWTDTGNAATGTVDTQVTREAANYLIQRNSTTAQRLSVAKTYTTSTNFEMFTIDNQTTSGVSTVGTLVGSAGGSALSLALTAQQNSGGTQVAALVLNGQGTAGAPFIRGGLYAQPGSTTGASNSSVTTWIKMAEGTSTATSGTVTRFSIEPTYNQSSGTAANTDLLINRTQTAVGSGAQLLIDAQVGSVSKFSVDNAGKIVSTSTVAALGYDVSNSSGFLGWSGRTTLRSSANGLMTILRNSEGGAVEINVGTAAPTVTSCGTGSVTAHSTNTAGEITATGATSCTVTFGSPAFTNQPFCTIEEETTLATHRISAISTTAFTVTGLTSGDKFMYHCFGGV